MHKNALSIEHTSDTHFTNILKIRILKLDSLIFKHRSLVFVVEKSTFDFWGIMLCLISRFYKRERKKN